MAGALTEGEQVCIALKAFLSLNPVGYKTCRSWLAEGVSASEGYDRLYLQFKEDSLFELAAFFTLIVRKGVDPDDFLAGCRLLGVKTCKETYPHLKSLPDNPVLLSRPQD
jgi:hypothetical protein